MTRYRLLPSPAQEAALREHCAHARFVWNLAVGQLWVRFRWSRAVPAARSCRVTRDRAGRWHVAFAANPRSTSQRCSACGYIAAESRQSQALFACVALNFTLNADVNAARNIAAGHAVTARGSPPPGGPVNREPQLLASSPRV